ncbi:hypothetical protein IF2G_03588 [Cordyceps javanica]|nr:hypothetical protein IF2G_03588 [Cordyceps javanica]
MPHNCCRAIRLICARTCEGWRLRPECDILQLRYACGHQASSSGLNAPTPAHSAQGTAAYKFRIASVNPNLEDGIAVRAGELSTCQGTRINLPLLSDFAAHNAAPPGQRLALLLPCMYECCLQIRSALFGV